MNIELLPIGPHDHQEPRTMTWTQVELAAIREYAARCVAAERERIDKLIRTHSRLSLETLEYLQTVREGPTPAEWAELDANAREIRQAGEKT